MECKQYLALVKPRRPACPMQAVKSAKRRSQFYLSHLDKNIYVDPMGIYGSFRFKQLFAK